MGKYFQNGRDTLNTIPDIMLSTRRKKLKYLSFEIMIYVLLGAILFMWILSFFLNKSFKLGPEVTLFIYAASIIATIEFLKWSSLVQSNQISGQRLVFTALIMYGALFALLYFLPQLVPSLYSTVDIHTAVQSFLNLP